MDEKNGRIWSHFENKPLEKINFGHNSKNIDCRKFSFLPFIFILNSA